MPGWRRSFPPCRKEQGDVDATAVREMIGTFDLDSNRVVDLVLHWCECAVSDGDSTGVLHPVRLLCAVAMRDALPHLFGLVLQSQARSTDRSIAPIFGVCAVFAADRMVSVLDRNRSHCARHCGGAAEVHRDFEAWCDLAQIQASLRRRRGRGGDRGRRRSSAAACGPFLAVSRDAAWRNGCAWTRLNIAGAGMRPGRTLIGNRWDSAHFVKTKGARQTY